MWPKNSRLKIKARIVGLSLALLIVASFPIQPARADSSGQMPQSVNSAEKSEIEKLGISEVAIGNMLIYSQEYMKYFFSDADSSVQPLPASGISLFSTFGIDESSRLLFILTIPLREERVYKKDKDVFTYYYPKMFISGYEKDWFETAILREKSSFRLSTSIGIGFPLSHRFLSYFPPLLLNRASVRLSKKVDLNFGVGYSGNVSLGAWFFPFGVSYRLLED